LPTNHIQRLLDQLDEAKRRFEKGDAGLVSKILASLARKRFEDAESLIRYHELLLFVRAYPPNDSVVAQAEAVLQTFADRVADLREAEVDLSPLEHPEVSGIAGTSVTDTFSYPIVRWLVRQQTRRVKLYWDWFEDENRLAQTWPRFMPLLEEDGSVEANVPFQRWLELAKGRTGELPWLIARFESLQISRKEKTELFDSQKLYVRWTPSFRSSRTGLRLPARDIFYHREPLIQRRDVSLKRELNNPPSALVRLTAKQGAAVLELTRQTSTIRYRELYGFTHGDPKRVLKADLGRGVLLFVFSLPPDRRLPLRAYHAAMIFKNGIPVGYFEGLSLFERMESGFNFYYGFREGETAWIYARTLNVFRHLLGVTSFAIDPYQVGHENEEGIESGAFWFYRKLGFRSTKPALAELTVKEEKKITERKGYRTSPRMLRQLASGSMIYELEEDRRGDWDRFEVRKIGFNVNRRMAGKLGGDPDRIRRGSLEAVARLLKLNLEEYDADELGALTDLSLAIDLIPDLDDWERGKKDALSQILLAKVRGDEARYLKLMQRHERLRAALIELGS
jgi:hypothetical protein